MVKKDIMSVLETYIDEKCKNYAEAKMDEWWKKIQPLEM